VINLDPKERIVTPAMKHRYQIHSYVYTYAKEVNKLQEIVVPGTMNRKGEVN
jgi:hypothetical protein